MLSILLTYSMVQSPSWETNWFAASQDIPRISRKPKVHYCTHKRPPSVSILGQPNPVHIPTSNLLEIHPNIIHHLRLGLPSGLLPSGFPSKNHPYSEGIWIKVYGEKILTQGRWNGMSIVNHYIKSLNCYPSCGVIMVIKRGMKSVRRVADMEGEAWTKSFADKPRWKWPPSDKNTYSESKKWKLFASILGIGRNLLRIIRSAWLLWARQWNFIVCKSAEFSWPAK